MFWVKKYMTNSAPESYFKNLHSQADKVNIKVCYFNFSIIKKVKFEMASLNKKKKTK